MLDHLLDGDFDFDRNRARVLPASGSGELIARPIGSSSCYLPRMGLEDFPTYARMHSDLDDITLFFSERENRRRIGWSSYAEITELVEAMQFLLRWLADGRIPEYILTEQRYEVRDDALRPEGEPEDGFVDGSPRTFTNAKIAQLSERFTSLRSTIAEEAIGESAQATSSTLWGELEGVWSRIETSQKHHAENPGLDSFWEESRSSGLQNGPMLRRIAAVHAVIASSRATKNALDSAHTADEASERANQRIAALSAAILAQNQSKFAREQRKIAWWLRAMTVGLVVAAAIIGGVLNARTDPSTVTSAIHQLAVVAIILGLAGYVAKQGSNHMSVSIWAETLAVQLLTFDSFMTDVASEATRDEMRKQFALRAFGSAPEVAGDSDVSWIPQVLAAVAERK